MLYRNRRRLLNQTTAALHARPGASGFDRRFGGLVAAKGCIVVFYIRFNNLASAGRMVFPRSIEIERPLAFSHQVLIADEAGTDAAVFPVSVEFGAAAPAASQEVPDPT